ncbi:MAG: hypothetical protein WA004_15035 [Saprospiraceae bacterium]
MTRRLTYLFLLAAMLCMASPAHAQVGAKATIDSTSVLVGGQRHVRLSVNFAPGVRLLEPGVAVVDTSEAIELLSVSPWDTLSQTSQAIILEKDLLITAWDSGYFAIPAIPVPFEIQGKTDTVYTRSIPFSATLAPPDTLTIQPIKPIIEEPVKVEDFAPYFIGLLALAALVAVVWWWYKKRKTQPPIPQQPVVEIPPHTIALEKLDQLEKAQLWQKGQIKAYHTQLTYILREFLEKRFHILALESTSQEIAAQLQNLVSEELRQNITQLLLTSDMVKFAKAEPPEEVHQRLLEEARRFVKGANH